MSTSILRAIRHEKRHFILLANNPIIREWWKRSLIIDRIVHLCYSTLPLDRLFRCERCEHRVETIAIFGSGYVGLVTGVCLAHLGNKVICIDVDEEKITKLKNGIPPIYEKGLPELLDTVIGQNSIEFTTDPVEPVHNAGIIFIGVGTPPGPDGEADLSAVNEVAATIGKNLNGYKIIVNKSTVPPGTGDRVEAVINKHNVNGHRFDVLSNPEFLREGVAVEDFLYPDRVVIGGETQEALEQLKSVYEPLKCSIHLTDRLSSELIKYASNCFLAVKISFINELSRLAEKLGADIEEVATGMGLDKRIGPHFLKAGAGYGGSCFPKDTQALATQAKKLGSPLSLVDAAIDTNELQKMHIVEKVNAALGTAGSVKPLSGKKIGIIGLAFKPGTDDMREAPSLTILPALRRLGAELIAYDPQAMDNARDLLPQVLMAESITGVAEGADALLVLTEWPDFLHLSPHALREAMRGTLIVDARNCLETGCFEDNGFTVIGVGRGRKK